MASNNTYPCQYIFKAMSKPKHPTKRSSTASRNPSPTRRANGQTNSPDVYGHIAPPKDEPPVKLFSFWHLVENRSFLLMSLCQVSALNCQSIEQNSKEMATCLNLAKEKREQTITRIAAYQQQLLTSYNKRARIRQFQPKDLVQRKDFIIARG
ncbi:hypothetical protein ACFXTI_030653 [Malus domestica]